MNELQGVEYFLINLFVIDIYSYSALSSSDSSTEDDNQRLLICHGKK